MYGIHLDDGIHACMTDVKEKCEEFSKEFLKIVIKIIATLKRICNKNHSNSS